MLKLKLVTLTQGLAYIPAYNTPRAYSANETDTFAFPAYKNLSISMGTMDSYLNDPPATEPPTKRNSFQFTMGLTYAIKSKY
jgi:heme-binding NEAT domain protein